MERIPLVRNFMTKKVITVTPEMDIFSALSLLLDHRISGAPVICYEEDKKKRLVGILTEKDCMSVIVNGAFHDLPAGRVSDYMSKVAVTVEPEVDIFSAADYFIRHHYRRIPVIEKGILVGIISRRDVLYTGRKLWKNQHAGSAPDPGYLTENLKRKLGSAGMTTIHKRIR